MKTLFIAVFFILHLGQGNSLRAEYKSVQNKSLSKYESIEKIDEYLNKEVSVAISNLEKKISVIEKTVNEKILPALEQIQASQKKLESDAVMNSSESWLGMIEKMEKFSSSDYESLKKRVSDLESVKIGQMETDIAALKYSIRSLEAVVNTFNAMSNSMGPQKQGSGSP